MSIKKASIIASFLSLLILFPLQVFSGIASGTQIAKSGEPILIENLVVGSKISGYTAEDNSFSDVLVENIEHEEIEGFYVITTDKGVIEASGDQLFYEIVSQKFIRAEKLKPGDFLLTKNSEALPCISVEYKSGLTKVYDLTLEEPHLFFSSEAQVLMHNTPILILTIPPVVPVVVTALACVGAVALDFYVEKLKHSSNRRDRMDHGNKGNHQHYQIPSDGGQMPDPNDPKKKKDDVNNEQIKISENKIGHIFRKDEGHFEVDSLENRKILEDLANDKKNYLGPNRWGNSWYAKLTDDGKQIWAEVRDNNIINAGINHVPKVYNPITGLSRQLKPPKG